MDFLENANDLSNVRVRLFDCNTESIVFDSINCEDPYDPVNEIYMTEFADEEALSWDLYLHDGIINLELNIEYEPEEDEFD
jgi:hypothetical protein